MIEDDFAEGRMAVQMRNSEIQMESGALYGGGGRMWKIATRGSSNSVQRDLPHGSWEAFNMQTFVINELIFKKMWKLCTNC